MNVQEKSRDIFNEVKRVIAGQDRVLAQILVAILADGHILLEGVPGVAKTLMVRTFSKVLGIEFGRIQFTPDLMPSDILGTMVFNPQKVEFELKKGPIFVGMLLADEINRTPPKTQAALLEAMEERQSTIDGNSLPLPKPFLVMATQNPIDYEGTYPLPEAQQDRFLMKLLVNYPEAAFEIEVLKQHHAGFRAQDLDSMGIQQKVSLAELQEMQKTIASTVVEDKVFGYIQGLVAATRSNHELLYGASPRAGIALMNSAKAQAQIRGREFLIPDDVRDLALPVLRHRVVLRPEAEVEGLTTDQVLEQIISMQTVPR